MTALDIRNPVGVSLCLFFFSIDGKGIGAGLFCWLEGKQDVFAGVYFHIYGSVAFGGYCGF